MENRIGGNEERTEAVETGVWRRGARERKHIIRRKGREKRRMRRKGGEKRKDGVWERRRRHSLILLVIRNFGVANAALENIQKQRSTYGRRNLQETVGQKKRRKGPKNRRERRPGEQCRTCEIGEMRFVKWLSVEYEEVHGKGTWAQSTSFELSTG